MVWLISLISGFSSFGFVVWMGTPGLEFSAKLALLAACLVKGSSLFSFSSCHELGAHWLHPF